MVYVTADPTDWWTEKMKKVGLGNNPLAADIGVDLFPWKTHTVDDEDKYHVAVDAEDEDAPDTDDEYQVWLQAGVDEASDYADEDENADDTDKDFEMPYQTAHDDAAAGMAPYTNDDYPSSDDDEVAYDINTDNGYQAFSDAAPAKAIKYKAFPAEDYYPTYDEDEEAIYTDNDYDDVLRATPADVVVENFSHARDDYVVDAEKKKKKKKTQKRHKTETYEGQDYVLLDFDHAPYKSVSPDMLGLAFTPPPPLPSPPKWKNKNKKTKNWSPN